MTRPTTKQKEQLLQDMAALFSEVDRIEGWQARHAGQRLVITGPDEKVMNIGPADVLKSDRGVENVRRRLIRMGCPLEERGPDTAKVKVSTDPEEPIPPGMQEIRDLVPDGVANAMVGLLGETARALSGVSAMRRELAAALELAEEMQEKIADYDWQVRQREKVEADHQAMKMLLTETQSELAAEKRRADDAESRLRKMREALGVEV